VVERLLQTDHPLAADESRGTGSLSGFKVFAKGGRTETLPS